MKTSHSACVFDYSCISVIKSISATAHGKSWEFSKEGRSVQKWGTGDLGSGGRENLRSEEFPERTQGWMASDEAAGRGAAL